jgi:hypothetical protein
MVSRRLPARFWFEALTGVAGLILFAVTLISRQWIEALTGWDPDHGSGAVELAIAVSLSGVSAASLLGARRLYARAATPTL